MAERIKYPELNNLLRSPRLAEFAAYINQVLTSEEQARIDFYNQIDEDDKAEYINGEIIMHSPVKLWHSNASSNLATLMHVYVQVNDLGLIGVEKLMISLTRNDYEPDIVFFRKERAADFEPKQMRFPAPDLIVEILSDSTAENDRGVKYEDYGAHGVEEYWIIDPEAETVEQYLLKDGEYKLALKSADGTLKSQAMAGFNIPIRAIFDKAENTVALKNL
ncbi:MAG: Uma2 family endonuclease [Chloroflexota bacterium]